MYCIISSKYVSISLWYYDNTIWARGWHQKYHPAAQGLRAKPEARGLRDGIFDATQGPIWYFYYLIVYFMKNICRNSFDIKWHQKMVLKILAFKISQKIRQSTIAWFLLFLTAICEAEAVLKVTNFQCRPFGFSPVREHSGTFGKICETFPKNWTFVKLIETFPNSVENILNIMKSFHIIWFI